MYDEYVAHFKKYSGIYGPLTAIFFQVGKFFEFYDILDPVTGLGQTTTKKMTDMLGVKLTYKKASGPGNRDGLWAGVPTQSLHVFASRLTREGWTVVVFEEEKDQRGKIKRDVTRVLSPGTHIESQDSINSECFYLATLFLEEAPYTSHAPPAFSASAVDLTTGSIISYSGTATGRADTWAFDDLVHFFQVHPPRECVVFWKGDCLTIPTESLIRERTGLPFTHFHIRQYSQLTSLQRNDILKESFRVKSLLPIQQVLDIENNPFLEGSLICLCEFVSEHFPMVHETFSNHSVWHPTERMFLGNNVLAQVNFIGTTEEDSILGLFLKTHTLMGKRAMRRRLLYPITQIEKLTKCYEEIQFVKEMPKKLRESFHIRIQHIGDLPRIHRKIQTYKIQTNEVLVLEESYSRILTMAKELLDTPLEMPGDLYAKMQEFYKTFHSFFDIEKAARGEEDTFFLPAAKAPKTEQAEGGLRILREKVAKTLREIEVWAGLSKESLKVEEKETSVYSVSCGKAAARAIAAKLRQGAGPTPDISVSEKKSGAVVTIPIFDTWHEEAVSLKELLGANFQEELAKICQEFYDETGSLWLSIEDWIAGLDVILTLERVCTERGFVRPTLTDAPHSSVDIQGLRHPIIEARQTRVEYITHDVKLDKGSGWLVYGMNASGKSSLMKALGICVLLAQTGCFVPARTCTLSPFYQMFTRILNHDNIWAGLSSFAVEMSELREILKRADPRSLVLGDEVCNGTESTSATSLVAAALQWLTQRSSCFVFATHLHGLLELPSIRTLEKLHIRHLRVRYDPATGVLIYDRTLQEGAGSSLYGLEVARALALPYEFIESALKFRRELRGSVNDEETPRSAYNSVVVKKTCAACGADCVSDLETHHLRQQSEADENGILPDGQHMNHARNLTNLCRECHDKHHAGILHVGQVVQTSEGEVQQIATVTPTPSSQSRSKWTSEQQQIIITMLREKKNAPIHWIQHELEKQGIEISTSSLSKVRKNGRF
jgi:DNA mismatch repair protein MutS